MVILLNLYSIILFYVSVTNFLKGLLERDFFITRNSTALMTETFTAIFDRIIGLVI